MYFILVFLAIFIFVTVSSMTAFLIIFIVKKILVFIIKKDKKKEFDKFCQTPESDEFLKKLFYK